MNAKLTAAALAIAVTATGCGYSDEQVAEGFAFADAQRTAIRDAAAAEGRELTDAEQKLLAAYDWAAENEANVTTLLASLETGEAPTLEEGAGMGAGVAAAFGPHAVPIGSAVGALAVGIWGAFERRRRRSAQRTIEDVVNGVARAKADPDIPTDKLVGHIKAAKHDNPRNHGA